jgi:pimeloyl-ACP methyl ester carboxylesterase
MPPDERTLLDQARGNFLALALAAVSRGLMLRDSLLGVTRRLRRHPARERISLSSGDRILSAVCVVSGPDAPNLLICHGIGETVEHWSAVQALLCDLGISSMIFNYSGYARSTGRIRPENCDQDSVSAYATLRNRVGPSAPIFLLGFSLGSGIAAHGASALSPPIAGLFLCEAFDSLRNAANAAGAPRWLTRIIPDRWNTITAVPHIRVPIYVIHCTGDRLFPLEMPRKIAAASNGHAELLIIQGLSHGEPYLTASKPYWLPIFARIKRASAASQS